MKRHRPGARRSASSDAPEASEKLHKVLARAGFGSRREIERWIEAGRIVVNGRPARLGERITSADVLHVDGRRVASRRLSAPEARVLVYHKPVGEVCTRRDDARRPSVFHALPRAAAGRWVAVGRLDVNTSGLLLFTTDGALAHALMHPSRGIEREYSCRVYGTVSAQALSRASEGVELEDGVARFDAVRELSGEGRNRWYQVTVSEGRNRLVRRLWQALGVEVSRLSRLRYGPITLPRRLRPGRYEELTGADRDALYDAAGLVPPAPVAGSRKS